MKKEEQLLNLLRDIESGQVTLTLDSLASVTALETENGLFHYDTSNGYRIGIFVDCGRFDYLDYIQKGRVRTDYHRLNKHYPQVREYYLKFRNPRLAQKVWGIKAKLYVRT